MNRKKFLISGSALLMSIAAVGIGAASVVRGDDFYANANNGYSVVWDSPANIVEGKLFMPGQTAGAKVEVNATGMTVGTGKIVSLLEGGTFENITGIGSIESIALTYRVGNEEVDYNGSTKSVLDVEFGYYYDGTNAEGNIADARIAFTEKKAFANDWGFAAVAAKPSFVRFTSTTAETIHINKIDIKYGCLNHADIQDTLDGAYVVGEGSFVKNEAPWNAFGGVAMTHKDGQNEVVLDLKKGDKFSFKNRGAEPANMDWKPFTLQSKDAKLYKANEGGNVEIVADAVKLGIYLKDNGDLYLSPITPEPPVTESKTLLTISSGLVYTVEITGKNPNNDKELMSEKMDFVKGAVITFKKATGENETPILFQQAAVDNADIKEYLTISEDRKSATIIKDVNITFYIGDEVWPALNLPKTEYAINVTLGGEFAFKEYESPYITGTFNGFGTGKDSVELVNVPGTKTYTAKVDISAKKGSEIEYQIILGYNAKSGKPVAEQGLLWENANFKSDVCKKLGGTNNPKITIPEGQNIDLGTHTWDAHLVDPNLKEERAITIKLVNNGGALGENITPAIRGTLGNGWDNPVAMTKVEGEDAWVFTTTLKPGTYEFKFVGLDQGWKGPIGNGESNFSITVGNEDINNTYNADFSKLGV